MQLNDVIDFKNPDFLIKQIKDTLTFYDKCCIDSSGGFYHNYMNNGALFSLELKTLVASCRFTLNYAKAYKQFGDNSYKANVLHGLAYLRDKHRDKITGGYAWQIDHGKPIDRTNHCYGLAFVLLAYAHALDIGITSCKAHIYETFNLMEQHFWLPQYERYASEADENWILSRYRGQNDNMHACEAMIVAYQVTGDTLFLDRAYILAKNMTQNPCFKDNKDNYGPIWEHYNEKWICDLNYNKDNKSNHLRPWGIQTGHQTEWAKLLIILERYRPEPWLIPRAQELFNLAMRYGWDNQYQGLIYGYDLDGMPYDQEKYFWVQAESIAAAALLADRIQDNSYWEWYNKIWNYSFLYFVDHTYGAWYRILSRENKRYDDKKSYSNKADYHTMGACYDVLNIVSHLL